MAGSGAAYMASRGSVFAAGGQNNCVPCYGCVFTYCIYISGVNSCNGTLDYMTKEPIQNAFVYYKTTIYTGLSCQKYETPYGSNVYMVSYQSCDGDCIAPLPPPNGVYTGSNGQNPSKPTITVSGEYCSD